MRIRSFSLFAPLALVAACAEHPIDIQDFSVSVVSPYPPAIAEVTGRIQVPKGTAGKLSATVNYGDGSTEDLTLDKDGKFYSSHTFTSPGSYAVVVDAVTNAGGHGTAVGTADVATPVTMVALECVECDANGCVAIDCGGPAGNAVTFRAISNGGVNAIRYRWDFGDSVGGVQAEGQVVTHEYHNNQTYTVKVMAQDSLASAASMTKDVTITNLGTVSASLATANGTAREVTATIRARGEPPMNLIVSWGDQSTNIYPQYQGDNSAFEAPHTFAQSGTFTVSITAVDRLGRQGTASHSVTVP